MKRIVFALAIVTGTLAMAGSATAATTITRAYPGKNGLIAFARGSQIYTINALGAGLKKLTTSGKNSDPVWNPAGTEIAYEHQDASLAQNIWVMNANGSDKRRWTNTGTTYGAPAWSPSGKQLLLTNGGSFGTLETTSGTTPLQPRHVLHGYNRDQGGRHTALQGNNPSWTTGKIAFTGTNLRGNGNMCDPAEGSSEFETSCIEVYDTSTQRFQYPNGVLGPLAAGDGCEGFFGNFFALDRAHWAPDGSNLVFQYEYESSKCEGLPWSISALHSPAPATRPGDWEADYSPDGRFIVLTHTQPGKTEDIIIESNTGANRRILTQGSQPNWQPLP